jgi:hypothetical protein
MSDSGDSGDSGGIICIEEEAVALAFAARVAAGVARFAAGAGLRFATNDGSSSERTWSRLMRSVASSAREERTISAKGAGSSGRVKRREESFAGKVLVRVSQRETPSDQISEAGKRMDSGGANGAASGQVEPGSPAGRMRSTESLMSSPMA